MFLLFLSNICTFLLFILLKKFTANVKHVTWTHLALKVKRGEIQRFPSGLGRSLNSDLGNGPQRGSETKAVKFTTAHKRMWMT